MKTYKQYKFKFYLNMNHFIYNNDKPGEVHPHTWELMLSVISNNDEMTPFFKLERKVEQIMDVYQDKLLNDCEPFNEIVPTVENAAKYFKNYSDKQICDFLKNAVNKINKIIFNKASESKNMSGMGTTIVCCIIYNNKCYIANVGDSRLYKFDDKLNQITQDHSYVSELVQMGVITQEQAKTHPNKNVITKAVGTEQIVTPDTFIQKINPKDVLLLCSDGLTNMVSEEDISQIILSDQNLESKVSTFIELAKENGGRDNITVVMIEISDGGVSK